VRASKKGRGEEKRGGKEEIKSFSSLNFLILDKKVEFGDAYCAIHGISQIRCSRLC
jgi:hypothetical protein